MAQVLSLTVRLALLVKGSSCCLDCGAHRGIPANAASDHPVQRWRIWPVGQRAATICLSCDYCEQKRTIQKGEEIV